MACSFVVPMDPDIGHGIEPVERLGIEIGVTGELTAIEEALAHVTDGALDLPLGLGAVGAAGQNAEAPVSGEAQELGVFDHLASVGSVIVDDHGLHLVEEELLGYAAEEVRTASNHRYYRLPL